MGKKLTQLERISLKNHPEINEAMLQDYIYKNPSVLGLGDLEPIQKEKLQSSGGRLDILMRDADETRYEIEIQLGETDPSHIIRTIEYWDAEKRRYPGNDHCAVLVAEKINGRFLNVISLFNGAIPIIALQVSAQIVNNDEIALIFTKVLDKVDVAPMDETPSEPTDRNYWEKKAPKMIKLMDELYQIIPDISNSFKLNYTKFYVGLTKDGKSTNFIYFQPQKGCVMLLLKGDYNDDLFKILQDSGVDIVYKPKWREYKIRLSHKEDYTKHSEQINELIEYVRVNFLG